MIIEVLDVHLNVAQKGAGADICLLHGWGADQKAFTELSEHLSERFAVTLIDLPGHGGSEEPKTPLSADDFARITIAALEKLGIKNPILIGHSNGGRTILSMVGRLGYKAKKLVLIDSAGIRPRRSLSYYLKVYSYKSVKWLAHLLLNEEKAAAAVDKYRRRAGSDDYNSASPVMRATLSKLVNDDLTPDLPNVNVPTLLIWGDNDEATPVSDGKLMERLIPDAGLVVLKGCSHFSYLEKPYEVRVILDEFLK